MLTVNNTYDSWDALNYAMRNLDGFAGAYRVNRMIREGGTWFVSITFG